MFTKFVRRPVLAVVVSILICLLGLISLARLPRTLYPAVAPPEVNVTVEYTGANAETVTKAAIVPLERAINGVPGMKYMSSDAGNDGVGVVQVIFETGTDPDVAAINVQNRVNAVMGELPSEVIKNGVKIGKEENAMLMYLSIFSDNIEHDEKFLYNFADINVLGELKRIQGVGYADILGAKEYAMRIWLKPDRMVAYGLSADDVIEALELANVEAAPGKIGENSDRGSTPLQYTVRYSGKFNTPEQYASIPLRSRIDGSILRIRDVAEVEFGTSYFDVEAKFDGRPAAAIMLKQLPGSNASDVITAVKARLAELQREAFLPGMEFRVSFDVSRFLDASVRQVVQTLLEALLLVSLVVFLFLQDRRSTAIVLAAVPVSLVGTFAMVLLLGFSLNLITLFALLLAIGIVVDDAIVVVEAVHAKMEATGLSPREATVAAVREIGGAIVAITLVMTSVFLPVSFIGGASGIFYKQFSLTMAVAIALSGVVALTLTPALCAKWLKPHHGASRPSWLGRFFAGFNARYDALEGRAVRVFTAAACRRVVTLGLLAVFIVGTGAVSVITPTGFIPQEDQGLFYASVTAPPGATLERTKEVVDAIREAGQDLPGVESIATLAGTNVLSDGTGASYGTALVNLQAWEDRDVSDQEIMEELARRTRHIKDARIEFFPPPPVPGYGNASGFELRLLDKTGSGDFAAMQEVVNQFVQDLQARPEIESAFTIFDAGYPQYVVDVDIEKAAQKGVSVDAAMGTLQTMLGSEYATNFIRFGQMYKVMVQALPEYRAAPEDLLELRVKSEDGELVPFAAFATLRQGAGVDQVTRYNMYTSAELNGEGAPGVSSGAVLQAVQEVAGEKLPRGFGIAWAGVSLDEIEAGAEGLVVFWICLLFVYLVLSAKYESFVLPLVVLLSLPPGVFGAFFFVLVAGLENNLYTHVALVMLIGLLGKNAILVVEYAEQLRAGGASIVQAAIDASRLRLRPILMTSFAFIAGLLPLVFATGAGAAGNRTIGTTAAGGMLVGTAVGVVLVPGLYVIAAGLPALLRRRRKSAEPAEGPVQTEVAA